MNSPQIRHIASVFSLIAFAEFGAFGYTALKAHPIAWAELAISVMTGDCQDDINVIS